MTYTTRQHDQAAARLLADARRVSCPEEGCPGELEYIPPYPAEEDTNTARWDGGVDCDCCDYRQEDDAREPDDREPGEWI